MKLQLSFDTTDLQKTIELAKQLDEYADIFEIGTILIYLYGKQALETFRTEFPQKTLLADTKIVDRGKLVVSSLAATGINWITVMAGTSKRVIHAVCAQAHNEKMKVMMDLLDASSLGQSALEAKNLGVDALLFHQPYEEQEELMFLDKWDMVKGNSQLPIFISGKISRETINEVLPLGADGLIIGRQITDADDPVTEAAFFRAAINGQ